MYLFSFSFLPVSLLGLNNGYALSKKGLRQQSPKFNKLQRKKVHRRRINTVFTSFLPLFFSFRSEYGEESADWDYTTTGQPMVQSKTTGNGSKNEKWSTCFHFPQHLVIRSVHEKIEHYVRPTHGSFRTNKNEILTLSFFVWFLPYLNRNSCIIYTLWRWLSHDYRINSRTRDRPNNRPQTHRESVNARMWERSGNKKTRHFCWFFYGFS